LAIIAVASGISLGAFAQSASAQESLKDDFEPVFMPFTWAGFYAGLNAGGHWSDKDSVRVNSPAFGASSFDTDLNGFIGGGQIGYNWQTSNVVWGLEADIQALDASHRFAGTFAGASWEARSKLEWLGSIRGRLGITPDAKTLLYVTGGFAYGGIELRAAATAPFNDARKSSETATGWTLGGGAEFAISSNMTVRGEYLYYDLDGEKVSLAGGLATARSDYSGHITRVGVNFKF